MEVISVPDIIQPEQEKDSYLQLHSGVAHMTYILARNSLLSSLYVIKRVLPYLEADKVQRFLIPISDVCNYLQLGTRNRKYIMKMFRDARKADIQFNILDKDKKNNYIESGLFSEVGIIDGNVAIEIPPELKRRLIASREMFVNLDLEELASLEYHKAVPLAIVMTDICQIYKKQTDVIIELDILRKMLGYKVGSYSEYKDFNKFVLKKAVSEVNEKSSINVRYKPHKRENRKITSIKFFISPKEKLLKTKRVNFETGEVESTLQKDFYYPTDKAVIEKLSELGFVPNRKSSEPLLKLMEKPYEFSIQKIDRYLLFILSQINFETARDAGALINSSITKGTYFDGFLIREKQKVKQKSNKSTKIKVYSDLLVEIIKRDFDKQRRNSFKAWLQEEWENVQNKVLEIIATDKVLRRSFQKSESSRIELEDFTAPRLANLAKFSEALGYSDPLVGSWMEDNQNQLLSALSDEAQATLGQAQYRKIGAYHELSREEQITVWEKAIEHYSI